MREKDGTMTTTELLFALLRSEVCGTEIRLPESITDETLAELYCVANSHDVAHIVSNALHKQGRLGADEISQKFLKKQMFSVYRCEQLKYAFKEIGSVFEKERIPYIPLKGSVLHSYYPEEWMRTSCDVDIWVCEKDLSRSVDALVGELGYKTDNKRNYHGISLHSPSGIHLELHFNIQENMDNIDRLLSKVWEYSKRYCIEGFRYHQTDDKAIRYYCRQCGIEDFYHHALYVTEICFGDKAHILLFHQIEYYILMGGVYGSVQITELKKIKERKGKIGRGTARTITMFVDSKAVIGSNENSQNRLKVFQLSRKTSAASRQCGDVMA